MAVYIDKELCKSCAMCVSLCPKKVFEITHLVNKKGYNYAAAVRQHIHTAFLHAADQTLQLTGGRGRDGTDNFADHKQLLLFYRRGDHST